MATQSVLHPPAHGYHGMVEAPGPASWSRHSVSPTRLITHSPIVHAKGPHQHLHRDPAHASLGELPGLALLMVGLTLLVVVLLCHSRPGSFWPRCCPSSYQQLYRQRPDCLWLLQGWRPRQAWLMAPGAGRIDWRNHGNEPCSARGDVAWATSWARPGRQRD